MFGFLEQSEGQGMPQKSYHATDLMQEINGGHGRLPLKKDGGWGAVMAWAS